MVCKKADEKGMKVAEGVEFYIQYGSKTVKNISKQKAPRGDLRSL